MQFSWGRAACVILTLGAIVACGDGHPIATKPADTTPVDELVVVSGNYQSANVNHALSSTLTVRALDIDDEPVPGVAVNFAVGAGAATVSPASDTTDDEGYASTQVTLGAKAGPVAINAKVHGTSVTTSFDATALPLDPDSTSAPLIYNPDWAEASHGKVAPNYAVAFPQNAVNTLEITMTASQWTSIRSNMTTLFGNDFGSNASGAPPYFDPDPDYIAATLKFNGKVWKKVGFRPKGVSSLSYTWSHGIYKLPFRLKTDEFEDVYPAINDQRFYGFKELSFAPGYDDPSLIREKSFADVMRAAGVQAAQSAFYRVYIDFGEGLKYCGVYTMLEVIDDTMVKDQFGEDKGNIYKPVSGLRVFLQDDFEKKNNKASDYSDVQGFVNALHKSTRTTDPEGWRAGLEATFDVQHFLKWLAVNNAMVNWDVYGVVAHNYYLYNSPTKKLTWIPWDNNESLVGNPGVAGVSADYGLSLSMSEINDTWPLISYLVADPVYYAAYKSYLKDFNTNIFLQSSMNAMFDNYTSLIAPFVIGANGEQPNYTLTTPAKFSASLSELKAHVQARKALISTFVP